MRQGRLKFPADRPVGHYHCISRIVDRRFIFEEAEKEEFVRLMREYEAFCQVRVLTFCVMSNHYHILLEVPKRPDLLPTAEQVMEMLKGLGYEEEFKSTKEQIEMFRTAKDTEGEKRLLERFFRQMWDVSWFNRFLKQRFSAWYNHRTGRKGTLWEEWFKSVLVDGCGEALMTMAAYIDLNPVRAGLTEDPKDYRWCGYGEAVAGRRLAKEGFKHLVGARDRVEDSLTLAMATYRVWLFGQGEQNEGVDAQGRPNRRGIDPERVKEVIASNGKLRIHQYARCRVRYFVDGAAFGTRAFVEDIFQTYRQRFGPKRESGARAVRGLDGPSLFVLRDLRKSAFG